LLNERGLPSFRPRWRENDEFAWTPELEVFDVRKS
jgi:hypothetical protein